MVQFWNSPLRRAFIASSFMLFFGVGVLLWAPAVGQAADRAAFAVTGP
jgi:hypothetical protein